MVVVHWHAACLNGCRHVFTSTDSLSTTAIPHSEAGLLSTVCMAPHRRFAPFLLFGFVLSAVLVCAHEVYNIQLEGGIIRSPLPYDPDGIIPGRENILLYACSTCIACYHELFFVLGVMVVIWTRYQV